MLKWRVVYGVVTLPDSMYVFPLLRWRPQAAPDAEVWIYFTLLPLPPNSSSPWGKIKRITELTLLEWQWLQNDILVRVDMFTTQRLYLEESVYSDFVLPLYGHHFVRILRVPCVWGLYNAVLVNFFAAFNCSHQNYKKSIFFFKNNNNMGIHYINLCRIDVPSIEYFASAKK